MTTDTDAVAVKGLADVFKRILQTRVYPLRRNRKKPLPSIGSVTAIVERYTAKYQADAEQYTRLFLEGKTTSDQWVKNMAQALSHLYLTGVAAAAGNVQEVRQEMLLAVGSAVLEQKNFLERFATQIEADPEKYTAEKIVARLMTYRMSVKPLLHKTQRIAMKRPDLPFDPAERTNCYGNCKCTWGDWIVLDAEKGDYNIFWELHPAEHCETCWTRAAVCKPLKIRDGAIETDLSNPDLYRAE